VMNGLLECLCGVLVMVALFFHGRLVRNGWKVLRGSTARANTSTTGVASINVYVMLTNFDYGSIVPFKNSNIRLT
jgi:hypothetical protein